MLQLLNEPSWQRYIARHDISTEVDARNYLQERILPAYESGLGFWVAELKTDKQLVGICGLIKRPYLAEVDLGFALLEAFWGTGFANESSQGVIAYASEKLRLQKLQAITVPENKQSVHLLEKLKFQFKEKIIDPENEELSLYELSLPGNKGINFLGKTERT